MYSRLHSPSARFRASRGAALAGIIVLHVAAVAAAMLMKGPRADMVVQVQPIEVMLLSEPERSRPPEAPAPLQEVVAPQAVLPVINVELPAPAPVAITVVAVAPPTPVPATAPAPAPAPVSDGEADTPVAITQAEWVRMPSPVYPAAAKRAKAQGVVHVRALVDTSGHALKALVHRSSGFAALDRAACDSVLAALFRPYVRNGVPRSVDVIVPVTFALTTRGGGDRGPPRGRDRGEELELDIRGENHHAMRGHPEELGGLGAAALHVGE